MNDDPEKLPVKSADDVVNELEKKIDPVPAVKSIPDVPSDDQFENLMQNEVGNTFWDRINLFFRANDVPIISGVLKLLGFNLNLSMFSDVQQYLNSLFSQQTNGVSMFKNLFIGAHGTTSYMGMIAGVLTFLGDYLQNNSTVTFKGIAVALALYLLGRVSADGSKTPPAQQ